MVIQLGWNSTLIVDDVRVYCHLHYLLVRDGFLLLEDSYQLQLVSQQT